MTITHTDKKMQQMEMHHNELIRELAKQSKHMSEKDLQQVSKGLFGTSTNHLRNFNHKASSSK